MTDLTERLLLIAAWRTRGGPTPKQACPSVYETTTEAATTLETLTQENARLREALGRVERWDLPATGQFWDNDDGTRSDRPMGYEACWGSNGAREYIRSTARKALGGGDE